MQPVFQLILPFQLDLPFEAGGFPTTRSGFAGASGSLRSHRPKRVRRERTVSLSLELPLGSAGLRAIERDVV